MIAFWNALSCTCDIYVDPSAWSYNTTLDQACYTIWSSHQDCGYLYFFRRETTTMMFAVLRTQQKEAKERSWMAAYADSVQESRYW